MSNERRREAAPGTAVRWDSRRLLRAAHSGLAAAVAALFLLPLVWMAAGSLRQPGLPPPRTVEWLPVPPAWGNYSLVFELLPFGLYTLNSIVVAAAAVPLTLVTASRAG